MLCQACLRRGKCAEALRNIDATNYTAQFTACLKNIYDGGYCQAHIGPRFPKQPCNQYEKNGFMWEFQAAAFQGLMGKENKSYCPSVKPGATSTPDN
jgi:hypothetical protein